MSQLGLILQESLRSERGARTILGLLTEQMDGRDRGTRRRRTLKERFRFTGMGCCGATWVFRPVRNEQQQQEEEHQEEEEEGVMQDQQQLQNQDLDPPELECVGPGPSGSGMNLAAALAAERQLRGSQETETTATDVTPWRVSLMRLLEETEVETDKIGGVDSGLGGNDSVCCVCMGRKKGAAFIPCGHTFCRVCSRELWVNRGNCPLCNRSILQILDIF